MMSNLSKVGYWLDFGLSSVELIKLDDRGELVQCLKDNDVQPIDRKDLAALLQQAVDNWNKEGFYVCSMDTHDIQVFQLLVETFPHVEVLHDIWDEEEVFVILL
jgi:dTDP-4-dehydrorhamnose reductase